MAATNRPAHRPSGVTDDDEERISVDENSSLIDRMTSESTRRVTCALAFWTAVVLPFLHIPLLASGLEASSEWYAFLTLLALNAAALYVGHDYGAN